MKALRGRGGRIVLEETSPVGTFHLRKALTHWEQDRFGIKVKDLRGDPVATAKRVEAARAWIRSTPAPQRQAILDGLQRELGLR